MGGAERYCYDVAVALVNAGATITVLSAQLSPTEAISGKWKGVGLVPRIAKRYPIIEKALYHLQVPQMILKFALDKYCNSAQTILVGHFHLLPSVMKYAKSRNIDVWLTTYGIEIWRDWSEEEYKAVDYCKKIISISKYTADSIITRLPTGNYAKILVIPPSVDANIFHCSIKEPPPKPRAILTVGRMASSEAYKGHDLIIRALKEVEKKIGEPVEYRIAGSGNDIPRLQDLAKECYVDDKVHFLGRLSVLELVQAYQNCHVFAMPSYLSKKSDGTWTGEGFGIVYLEAAACGKPVLACDEGGQVDCVKDGISGVLVRPTVEDVRDGLIKILTDLNRANQMGEAGRALVESQFSMVSFNDKWEATVNGGL
jgi:glycosyltransferase involved in cell wall biosynthesis